MSQKNIFINYILPLLAILGISIFIIFMIHDKPYSDPSTATILNWNASETIRLEHDECKNINRSLAINRLIKDDFRIPMCPKSYVVLFDKFQNKVFIFNEGNNENPKIIITDTICDNSTGVC